MVRRRKSTETGVLKNEIDPYNNPFTAAASIEWRSAPNTEDKLNMEQDEDIFKEIMELIDKRNKLCGEWIVRLDKDHREGAISYDEYLRQTEMIHEEIAKTEEVLNRQKKRIEESKDTRK